MHNRVLNKWRELSEQTKSSLSDNLLKEFVTREFGAFLLEINRKEVYRLYIKINIDEVRSIVDLNLKGIDIYTMYHDRYLSDYLVIENNPQKNPHIFKLFTADLIDKIINSNMQKEKIIYKIIEEWKEYFKDINKSKLSLVVEQGLFAELLFIEELLKSSNEDIITSWVGPEKSSIDFLFKNIGVEVKSTTKVGSPIITISNVEQLNSTLKEKLFLKVYTLYQEGIGGRTLQELIDDIFIKLSNINEKLKFESKLAKVGFLQDHADLYTIKWGIRENNTYIIEDGFPRLVFDNIPLGIFNVSYTLNLSNCNEFKVENEMIFESLGGAYGE